MGIRGWSILHDIPSAKLDEICRPFFIIGVLNVVLPVASKPLCTKEENI